MSREIGPLGFGRRERLDGAAADPRAEAAREVLVLGHREPGVSAEHRISAHSHARLRRAEALCFQEDVRAVVLTGR